MSSDSDLLSNALERLEVENLRLKRIGMMALVLIGAVLLMGQSRTTNTVEAETFVLKGPDGSIRAKLGTKGGSTQLLFFNDAGQPRVAIKSNAEGEELEMRDDSGELLATVSVGLRKAPRISPTTSTIAVLGSLAGPGVIMDASKGIAVIRVEDKNGHRVWAASSKP